MRKRKNSKIIVDLEGTEILERDVSKFGDGAHVIIPKVHIGKKVKIVVIEREEHEESKKSKDKRRARIKYE